MTGECSGIDFLDDDTTKQEILGCCADWRSYYGSDVFFVLHFEINKLRLLSVHRLTDEVCSVSVLIDKIAHISRIANIGRCVMILPYVTINPNVLTECSD